MTILFMEWNSFGNEDMIENLEMMGHEVRRIPFIDDTLKQEQINMLPGFMTALIFQYTLIRL